MIQYEVIRSGESTGITVELRDKPSRNEIIKTLAEESKIGRDYWLDLRKLDESGELEIKKTSRGLSFYTYEGKLLFTLKVIAIVGK